MTDAERNLLEDELTGLGFPVDIKNGSGDGEQRVPDAQVKTGGIDLEAAVEELAPSKLNIHGQSAATTNSGNTVWIVHKGEQSREIYVAHIGFDAGIASIVERP